MYLFDESKLIEIFCDADDFCQAFEQWECRQSPTQKAHRAVGAKAQLKRSEIIAITVFFQLSGFKNFEYYYQRLVLPCWESYFPKLVSYNRFVELIGENWMVLFLFANWRSAQGRRSGAYYIDSKKLPVCHNRRIHQNRVFEGIARRGKSSTGWFFGLKIHLVINHLGEIIRFLLTPGNVADNNQKVLKYLLDDLQGRCFGDAGYLTKCFEHFFKQGLKLVCKVRSNMKNCLMDLQDKLLLKKRGIIESVNDILMTVHEIEHTRHRSPRNAFAHIFASLVAYSYCKCKPSAEAKYVRLIPA